MNKQELEKLHRKVCRGKVVPAEQQEEYAAYIDTICPPKEMFKSVPLSRTGSPVQSGLLNELSAPAGIKYVAGKGAGL